MTVKLVDYRVSLGARRLAFLAAALAPADVLNSSGCSNQAARTALAGSSPGARVVATALPAATRFPPSSRELDFAPSRIRTGDVPQRLDYPTGVSS